MATIVTRAGKGAALTFEEGDANFNNLNDDKIEAVEDDTAPALGGDLDVGAFAITTTEEDGDIVIRPDGEGLVKVESEGIMVGLGDDTAGIVTPDNTSDLLLATNDGDATARIFVRAGANGKIELTSNGTGRIELDGQQWPKTAPTTNDEYLQSGSDGNVSWTDRVNARTIYERVKNVSGATLPKGTPVYQVGVVGFNVTVAAARADDPTKLAIGILDEELVDEAEGRMLVAGEIRGVNTSGFTTGDRVYLGATGGYTNVKPTATDVAVQFLGVVNRVDANAGSGFITGTFLEDHIIYNLTNDSFLGWNGASYQPITKLSDDTAPKLSGNLELEEFSLIGGEENDIDIVSRQSINFFLNDGDENAPDYGVNFFTENFGDEQNPFIVTGISSIEETVPLAINSDAGVVLNSENGSVVIIANELEIEGVDIESTPEDDEAPAAFLKVTIDDEEYFLPLYQ